MEVTETRIIDGHEWRKWEETGQFRRPVHHWTSKDCLFSINEHIETSSYRFQTEAGWSDTLEDAIENAWYKHHEEIKQSIERLERFGYTVTKNEEKDNGLSPDNEE